MKRRLLTLVLALAASAPQRALGCAACFGRSDSALAVGMNYGILALLVVIGTMMGLVAGFFVFIARRADQLSAAPAQDPSALSEP